MDSGEIQSSDIIILNGDIASKSLAIALSISKQFDKSVLSNDQNNVPIILLDWDSHPSFASKNPFYKNLNTLVLSPTSIRFLYSIGVLQLCDP